MSLADTLSVVAIIVSVGTLLATLYEQYWKMPQLSLVLGDRAFISRIPKSGEVVFWACVVLANQGAEDAAILRIEGTLWIDPTRKYEIAWVAFGKYKDDEAPSGKSLIPLFAFEAESSLVFSDWADALVSSSRKASASWIAFTGKDLKEISPDWIASNSHNLQLNVITDNRRRELLRKIFRSAKNGVACSWTGSLEISADKLKGALMEAPNQSAYKIYSASLRGEGPGLRRKSPTITIGYPHGQE